MTTTQFVSLLVLVAAVLSIAVSPLFAPVAIAGGAANLRAIKRASAQRR